MRRLVLSAAIGALVLSTTSAVAEGGPPGRTCGLVSESPANSNDTFTGWLDGGPVLRPGVLHCELIVDGLTVGVASASGSDIVVLAPVLVSFHAWEWSIVHLCTTFEDAGYWYGVCHYLPRTDGGSAPDVVNDVAHWPDPLLCPALGAVAGSYGVATVSYEGDVYVGSDRVHDCPWYGYEDDERVAVIMHEGETEVDTAPLRGAGGITLSHVGQARNVVVTGLFSSPEWSCYDQGSVAVVCDYRGPWVLPRCGIVDASAAVPPPYEPDPARARTSATCMGHWGADTVWTETATPDAPFRAAQQESVSQNVYRVECVVDDGAWGWPRPNYIAECGFEFR